MATLSLSLGRIAEILGPEAESLLQHRCHTLPAEHLHAPGPDFVSCIWAQSDRPIRVLCSLQALFDHGRLAAA